MRLVLATLLALGGWIVPWQHEAGLASLAGSRGALSDVFLFAARLDDSGRPVLDERGSDWKATVARVHAEGARAWLTVVNDRVPGSGAPVLKDADIVHRVLSEPALGARHRAEILDLATSLGVDGVDIDYENLSEADRAGFTAFVRGLVADLHAAGLASSVTVQPKSTDGGSRGQGAMDWTALCELADRLQVMLYNEHNGSTDPGPIAGLDWMSRVVAYGQSRCQSGKLVPVLKVSGMDWGPDKAEWRTFAEVSRVLTARGLKPRREWWNRSPWFVYRDVDGRHTVHYEDARSLAAKADRLRARGLASLVLWSLGSEDPETIPRLAAAARPAASQKR